MFYMRSVSIVDLIYLWYLYILIVVCRSDDIESKSVTENCAGCELPIHVKNLVFDGEKNWHYKCFSCNQCNSGLVNQKYYDKEGTLLCNNCYLAKHLPTCLYCKKEIGGRSEYNYLPIIIISPWKIFPSINLG